MEVSTKYFTVITEYGLKSQPGKFAYVKTSLLRANYEEKEHIEQDLSTCILEREHDDEVVEA